MTRLFLDDIRKAPDGWKQCKDVECLKKALFKYNPPFVLSLDHDLGAGKETGFDFVLWLGVQIEKDVLKPEDFTIIIHSMNPYGGYRMFQALQQMGIAVVQH